MKRILTLLLALFLGAALFSCTRPVPAYTIDEAIDLMNVAIADWLDAESFVVAFEGTYESPSLTLTENIDIRMKRVGSSDLVANVMTAITRNDSWQYVESQYEDGLLYTARNENGTTERFYASQSHAAFEALYRSYLKTEIVETKTRSEQIFVDADVCRVTFELGATVIADILYVPTDIERVTYATVSVTFSHRGVLQSIAVSYGAYIGEEEGVETYSATFSKLDRYVVISRLSASEKATYTEKTNEE